MKEVDVALTDYGLALLCFIVAVALIRTRYTSDHMLCIWFSVLFLSIGVASGIGGTVHGFVHEDTLLHTIFWRGTILAIGVSTLSAWIIGSNILLKGLAQKTLRNLAIVNFTIYAGYVLCFNQDFLVAVANYLPAVIFLLVAFIKVYRQTLHPLAFLALVGLILTILAAAIQQLEIDIHPRYFGHNALYHVVQAVGLYLVFRGATFIIKLRPGQPQP